MTPENNRQKAAPTPLTREEKNRRTLMVGAGTAAFMLALSFASVPLYDLFCRATGFDGTTQRAETLPNKILARTMTVRFNTDVSPDLPWDFASEDHQQTVKIGEPGFTKFRVKNNSDKPLIGVAVYNVTPEKAGLYFSKVLCFCFDQQLLKPGEVAEFPVQYFVDPALAEDPNAKDIHTITLSYTFYPAASPNYERAVAAYEARQERLINQLR